MDCLTNSHKIQTFWNIDILIRVQKLADTLHTLTFFKFLVVEPNYIMFLNGFRAGNMAPPAAELKAMTDAFEGIDM